MRDQFAGFEPIMGTWYSIDAEAVKVHKGDLDYGDIPYDAMWDRRPFEKPQSAMYIGYRDVYCGNYVSTPVYDEDYETVYEGVPEFYRTYAHRIWLFVVNDRQNPIRVFPNDVHETRP